jgi:hypothetical protein
MPDTIRQQIIDSVIARLKTIKTTTAIPNYGANYKTDVGNNVYQERAAILNPKDVAPPGALNVFFPTEKSTNEVSRHHDHEMTVEVYGVIADGDNTSSDCEKIIADLTQAIGVDIKWNDNARDTLPGEFEKDVEQQSKKIVGFKRTFTIRYRTLRFDPYNKG